MIDRCKFIQFCQKEPEKLNYALWASFITNTRSLVGDNKVVEMCRPFLGQDDIAELLEQRKRQTSHRSCDYIRINGFKCPISGCGVWHPDELESVNVFIERYSYTKRIVKKIGNETVAFDFYLSNFIIIPQARLVLQETGEEYLRGDIYTSRHRIYKNFLFVPDSFDTATKFKRAMKGKLDLQFKGKEDEIQDIKRILTTYRPRMKIATRVLGLHQLKNDWLFICSSGCIDKKEQNNKLVLLDEQARILCNIINAQPLNDRELERIAAILFNFNVLTVTAPILGWCFACFFKPRIFHLHNAFPILIVHGEPGCGKTKTITNIVQPLFGLSRPPESISACTEFTFMREISSSNCVPVIYDEHKLTVLSQDQRDNISEMIRSVYNNLVGSRGRPDQSQIEYPYSAPIAILGEQGVIELAHRDRIIDVFMTIRDRRSKVEFEENYDLLCRANLQGFGNGFLRWTLGVKDSSLKIIFEEELDAVDQKLTDRVRVNTAFGRFGIRMVGAFLEEHYINFPLRDELLLAVDKAQIENLGTSANRKSVAGMIIEAFSTMAEHEAQRLSTNGVIGTTLYHLNRHEDWYIKENKLALNISKIYPKFKKWVKDYNWPGEVLDKDEFIRQLKNDDKGYYVEYKTVNTGKQRFKAHILDLTKMDHLELGKWQEQIM